MKYTRVMQALAKDNVYISYLNQEYSSYEKISPPLAFMREEWPTSKQKDVDIYIESTFGF